MLDPRASIGLTAGVMALVLGAVGAALTGDAAVTVALAVATAAAHAIALPTSSGRGVPLTVGVAAAGALVVGASTFSLLSAGLLGLPIGYLILLIHRGPRAVGELVPAEPVGYLVFVLAVGLAHAVRPHDSAEGVGSWIHLGMIVVASVAWFAAETGVRVMTAGSRHRVGQRLLLRRGLSDWQAFAALVGAGATFGLTLPAMGWWAVPLAGVPYLFSHLALVRARRTRRTYRQTIGALGRIPEAGGFSAPGHAERTADLSVAIGSQIGLGSRDLDRIEQAALLHDIGRLVLSDPVVAAGSYSTRDLAQWSSAIVAEVRHLEPVADVVADHYRPYRQPGQERDQSVAAPAQIVKVASAYSVALAGGMSPSDSLELLHRGSAYDYDPELVSVLRRVLQRRGVSGV